VSDANGFANEGRMRRIRATLATTDYVPSYGGFRLSLQDLELMLDQVTAGAVQTRLFHDSRRPLHVENVEARIEQRPDGEYALRVEFDADEDRWAEYEAERDAQGGPGGLSFTLVGTFENLPGSGEPTSVAIMVAADAAHFSDQVAPLRGAGPGVSAAARPWKARAAHAGPRRKRLPDQHQLIRHADSMRALCRFIRLR
jgi:hypothetical protein